MLQATTSRMNTGIGTLEIRNLHQLYNIRVQRQKLQAQKQAEK